MHLVINALAERGTPSGYGTVRVADRSSLLAVFVTNSLGVGLVGQVDKLLVADPEFARDLAEAYESVAWQCLLSSRVTRAMAVGVRTGELSAAELAAIPCRRLPRSTRRCISWMR
jgi:hypothetical protein